MVKSPHEFSEEEYQKLKKITTESPNYIKLATLITAIAGMISALGTAISAIVLSLR